MGCDNCTHRQVCKKVDKVGLLMTGLLVEAFPAVNLRTAQAATLYTMASLCSHYHMEECEEISITIVSGD